MTHGHSGHRHPHCARAVGAPRWPPASSADCSADRRARPVASSVLEPDLGKVHRREALIHGTPLHGRRQPQRQFDGHLGKPVHTRLCEHGCDDTANRGRSAIIRENSFHRLVGPQAREQVDRLALIGSVLAHCCTPPDGRIERGLAALHDLIDQVLRDEGATGLGDLTVALSLELAKALEEIAREQDLAAVDLAEVWFAD
jgi:hypothetical protein